MPGNEVAPQAVMGIFGGTHVKTNMAEFSAESHGVDCSGDWKVLTELQRAPASRPRPQAITLFQIYQDDIKDYITAILV